MEKNNIANGKGKKKKTLGKLISIMVLDLLIEYREGLSVAELTNKIIEEYGLEEAAYEETLGKDVRQTVRGQVRRALEALTEIGEYLDLEKEGCGKNTIFWKKYGVELVEKRETDRVQYGKFYRLRSFAYATENGKLSDEELRILMFSIRGSQSFNGTQASQILRKLREQGSYGFRQEMKSSFVGEDFLSVKDSQWDSEFLSQDYVMENVSLLLQVIQENYRREKSKKETPEYVVEFGFYAYDERLCLRPSEEILEKNVKRRIVTPLKVFQDMGRFYVYVAARNTRIKNEESWIFLTYRVDLMCNLVIKNRKEASEPVYVPSSEQREELRYGNIKKYLNMSFSSEIQEIQFLFLRERITAIVDSFGRKSSNVKISRFHKEERMKGLAVVKLKEGTREIAVFDEEGKERVLCKVQCTAFGFLNWVMQYGDYALVLEPQSIVEQIKKKIELLMGRYGIPERKEEEESGKNV